MPTLQSGHYSIWIAQIWLINSRLDCLYEIPFRLNLTAFLLLGLLSLLAFKSPFAVLEAVLLQRKQNRFILMTMCF